MSAKLKKLILDWLGEREVSGQTDIRDIEDAEVNTLVYDIEALMKPRAKRGRT